jgi:trans-2,3-dihydro-3-hydroxyanthranilate isomerase
MPSIPFYIVDVFAAERYQGNQLAVFDARNLPLNALPTEQMQAIAREINFQEITFVMGGSPEAGFDVRIFTPEYEIPFAGHPTLGTAWVLANHLAQTGSAPLMLHMGVGPVPVRWESNTPWLTAAQPRFGPTFDPAELAQLLNLSPNDIDTDWPLERVSTGLLYVMVPVKSLAAMQKIRLDVRAFENWLLAHQQHKTNSFAGLHTSIYAFCWETYKTDNQLNARMFCFEQGKVAEDPATGSAGSCLLAYLLKNRMFGAEPVRVRVEQGYEVGRPSLLELDGTVTDAGAYSLQVGGQVQYVARGEWQLDTMQLHKACDYILNRLATELDPRLTYHNLAHTTDVVEQAARIAEAEGITNPDELALLQTAACFHDAGFLRVYDNHEAEGCLIATEVLPGFGYSPAQIDLICQLIQATCLPQLPDDHLGRILCDADLDYLGRADYESISSTLFAEWVAFGRLPDESRWLPIQQGFLQQHQYFTATNRQLREVKKQETLASLGSIR